MRRKIVIGFAVIGGAVTVLLVGTAITEQLGWWEPSEPYGQPGL